MRISHFLTRLYRLIVLLGLDVRLPPVARRLYDFGFVTLLPLLFIILFIRIVILLAGVLDLVLGLFLFLFLRVVMDFLI
jgi:hypothetical protein